MNNLECLIKYKIGILMSIVIFLIGIHEYAVSMIGKEAISPGGNIRGMIDPLGANIIIKSNMPINNVPGGPVTASQGPLTLPGMKSLVFSTTGTELTGGMYNIIPGIMSGQIILPDMFSVMGQIPLSSSGGMPLIVNMMISAIMGPSLMNPLMVGPDPMNLPIVWPGPMCPFSMASDLMGPLIMCPCTMCPFTPGPGPMNIMLMTSPMNSLKIEPYLINTTTLDSFLPYIANIYNINPYINTQIDSPQDQDEQYSEDCISKTIYKKIKKGNIVFLEVYDG